MYPKSLFSNSSLYEKPQYCFVLMPFANEFNEVYDIIKESLESDEINFTCKRADEISQPHIMTTVLENISSASLVVADLTNQNPNVFYELGIAHSFKNVEQVILLTQNIEDVPFDLRQYRCIKYEKSYNGAKILRRELTKTIREVVGEQHSLYLSEGETKPLNRAVIGKGNFAYEIHLNAGYIDERNSKIEVTYTKISGDGTKQKLTDKEWYGLSKGEGNAQLKMVPISICYFGKKNNQGLFIFTEH